MLSRAHRFHGLNSLRHVYQTGRSVRGAWFAVKTADNPRRRTFRVAVVVSRKVNKSAVARNRIRRRLYAVVRQHSRQIERPVDIVISVFSDAVLEIRPAELSAQLEKQLKAAGVIE